MESLFQSGQIIDLLIVLLAAECAVLVWVARRLRIGRPTRFALSVVVPGVFLMIAIRFALTDQPWPFVAAALAAAGVAHGIDLAGRLRR